MATFTIKEKAQGIMAGNSWDVIKGFENLADADQTSLWVIGFNIENVEIFRECVHMGGVSDMNADLSLIFRRILMNGATSWACVYNRVSGVCKPKSKDFEFGYALYIASRFLKITFFDLIILADDGFFSFCDHGHIAVYKKNEAETDFVGSMLKMPILVESAKVVNMDKYRSSEVC